MMCTLSFLPLGQVIQLDIILRSDIVSRESSTWLKGLLLTTKIGISTKPGSLPCLIVGTAVLTTAGVTPPCVIVETTGVIQSAGMLKPTMMLKPAGMSLNRSLLHRSTNQDDCLMTSFTIYIVTVGRVTPSETWKECLT